MDDNVVVSVGDVLTHCWGAYCHRTWEFARVLKITPTGRFRIGVFQKHNVRDLGNYSTEVSFHDNEDYTKTKLLRADRTYGRGTIAEYWYPYDPNKPGGYVDHFDIGA